MRESECPKGLARVRRVRGVFEMKKKTDIGLEGTTGRVARRLGIKRVKPHTKPKSISKLKKELDAIFSKFIRARDKGQCYTCIRKDDPKKMQNGHFIPRQYLSLRYSEINCHCQCYACNMLYNGQPSAYALHLVLDYGEDIVEILEKKRREITKLTPSWYEERILEYTALLAKMRLQK